MSICLGFIAHANAQTYLQLPLRQWGSSNVYLNVVQLKGKHCRKPHCRNGVVGTFWPCLIPVLCTIVRRCSQSKSRCPELYSLTILWLLNDSTLIIMKNKNENDYLDVSIWAAFTRKLVFCIWKGPPTSSARTQQLKALSSIVKEDVVILRQTIKIN